MVYCDIVAPSRRPLQYNDRWDAGEPVQLLAGQCNGGARGRDWGERNAAVGGVAAGYQRQAPRGNANALPGLPLTIPRTPLLT